MELLILMFIFIGIIFLGYFFQKRAFFSQGAIKDFSTLVTKIVLPAMILSHIGYTGPDGDRATTLAYLLALFLMEGFLIIVAFLLPKVINIRKDSVGMVQFLMVFNNNGFIGIPIARLFFGELGAFYAALTFIPFNIYMYSIGILFLRKGAKGNVTGRESLKKYFIQPGFLAALTLLLFFLLDFQIPTGLKDLFMLLGNMATPLSLLVLGMSISGFKLIEFFKDKRIYLLSFFKMVVFPGLVYLLAKNLPVDNMSIYILTIIAALPGATIATSFAYAFGGDEKLASGYVFVSTLISAVSLPVVLGVIGIGV